MQEVGRFSLSNNGGFVACIKFVYMGNDGMEHEVCATEGYPVLQTREASPGDCGVPDGSLVWLKAGVTAGYDNKSQCGFIYRAGNQQVADFSITGTTLHNHLQFKGVRLSVQQSLQAVKPMFWGPVTNIIAKAGQKLAQNVVPTLAEAVTQGEKGAGQLLKSNIFEVINKPIVAGPAMGVMGALLFNRQNKGDSVTTQSAFDERAVVSDAEFAKLVPQGLLGDIASELIKNLAPVVSELARTVIPLSANRDDVQLSTQGLLDGLVNTIMPAIIPGIGKLAVLLTQSALEEQAQNVEVPAQATAQPFTLPEAWRAPSTQAD